MYVMKYFDWKIQQETVNDSDRDDEKERYITQSDEDLKEIFHEDIE